MSPEWCTNRALDLPCLNWSSGEGFVSQDLGLKGKGEKMGKKKIPWLLGKQLNWKNMELISRHGLTFFMWLIISVVVLTFSDSPKEGKIPSS